MARNSQSCKAIYFFLRQSKVGNFLKHTSFFLFFQAFMTLLQLSDGFGLLFLMKIELLELPLDANFLALGVLLERVVLAGLLHCDGVLYEHHH